MKANTLEPNVSDILAKLCRSINQSIELEEQIRMLLDDAAKNGK